MKVNFLIYEERTKKNMSLSALAKEASVSKSQINAIENGKAQPKVNTLLLIAEALSMYQ